MKPKEVSLSAEDLEYINEKLSTIVEAVLTNDELEKRVIDLKIEIPEELHDIFQMIADKTGKSVQDSVGEAATQGINQYLKDLVKSGSPEPPPAPPAPKIEGMEELMKSFNMDNIAGSFGKIKDLADQLESIQKVLSNAADTSKQDKPDSNSTKDN